MIAPMLYRLQRCDEALDHAALRHLADYIQQQSRASTSASTSTSTSANRTRGARAERALYGLGESYLPSSRAMGAIITGSELLDWARIPAYHHTIDSATHTAQPWRQRDTAARHVMLCFSCHGRPGRPCPRSSRSARRSSASSRSATAPPTATGTRPGCRASLVLVLRRRGRGKGGGSVAALRVSAVAGPWYTVSCHVALAHTGTRAQRRLSRGPDGASRKAGCVAKTSPREWRLCRYEAGVAYGADEYHGRIGSTQRPFLMLSGDTDPQTGPCSQKPACPCPCPCFVLFCDSVCASLALLMTIDPQQVNPGSHAVASLALF